MQCSVCSKELKPDRMYCPACRAATPALGADFALMERRLSQLRTRRRAGIVSDEEYKAEVQSLVVHDAAGNTWWLGGGHGGWYWNNGPSWEPRDPAEVILAATAAPPAPPPPPAQTQRSWWPYLLIGCLVLGILIAIVVALGGFFLLGDGGASTGSANGDSTGSTDGASTGSAGDSTGSAGNSTGSGVESQVVDAVETLAPEDMDKFRAAMSEEIEDHRPETLAMMGRPDAFSITEMDVEGIKVAHEIWYYFGLATQVDFFNGEAGYTTSLAPVAENTVFPAWYDPLSFSTGMSKAEVIEVARVASPADQPPEAAAVEGFEQEFPGGELLIGDQILIALYDGRVVYVESVALFPEETSQ